MTYTFRQAVREQCFTLTGFAGPSGSGKTYTALRFAMGLAGGGKIAMIDTEARRGLHYADQFEYLYSELTAPFTPERYIEAIQAAEKAGASVIIVDSMSHEHEGPGGVLEMHDTELTRMAGEDSRKREQCKFAAWIKPKAAHNRFVNTVLQVKAHLIFCFRAKEKLKLVRNQKGKMEPVPMGWQPICTDRLEYEMTALLMLPPNSGGVPDVREPATKLQQQHRHIFDSGKSMDENMGKALAEWASGGAAPATNGHDCAGDPFDEGKAVAEQGADALKAWWGGIGKQRRQQLANRLDELKALATDADNDESDDVPFGEPDANGKEAPPAEQPTTAPYTLVNWDGTVTDCADWSAFRDAMENLIAAVPNRPALDGLWDSNNDAMNGLRGGDDEQRARAAEIERAFDSRGAELGPRQAKVAPRQGAMV